MQPSQQSRIKPVGLIKAILVGQFIVNGPVMLIIIGLTALGYYLFRSLWPLFLIVSGIIAWLWWAITVPRWRNWAIQQGCDANELHKMAVVTGLEWPKGSIFKKTEINPANYGLVGKVGSNEPFFASSSETLPEPAISHFVPMPEVESFPIQPTVRGKPFLIRGAAYIIDDLIYMAIFFPVEIISIFIFRLFHEIYSKSMGVSFETQQPSTILIFILLMVLNLVYLVIFTWLEGATPGKLILKMRVVTETGERVGFISSLIRSVGFLIDSMAFGIIAYFKMKPPLYQRNGDVLAKTIVVGLKEPFIKQVYPTWRILLSFGIFIICSIVASVIMGASTIGQAQPLVKTSAGQVNLQISDLPGKVKQLSDARTLPLTIKSITDENLREFVLPDYAIISQIIIFDHFPLDTNAALKQTDEDSLKKIFSGEEIRIKPAIEYTSSYRGHIQKFFRDAKTLDGYSLFILKKNVAVHLIVYGMPGSVTLDKVQQLKEMMLSRIH